MIVEKYPTAFFADRNERMLLMQHFVFDNHNPYGIGRQPDIT